MGGAVKTPKDRGEFGEWLRAARTARYRNVGLALADLQRRLGYGVAPSVWAELESGTRRPSAEQRQYLTQFFGSAPAETAQTDLTLRQVLALESIARSLELLLGNQGLSPLEAEAVAEGRAGGARLAALREHLGAAVPGSEPQRTERPGSELRSLPEPAGR